MNKDMVVVCGKSIEEVIAQVEIVKAARAMGATVGVGGSMEEVKAMLSSVTEGCERDCACACECECDCACACECECDHDCESFEDEILEEVLGHDVAQLALRMSELSEDNLDVIDRVVSAMGV